jgi:hypothetical protein
VAGLGSIKIHNNDFPERLSIFKNPLTVQGGVAGQTSGFPFKDIADFKESFVFSVPLHNMHYYWIGNSDDYNRSEPRASYLLVAKDIHDLTFLPMEKNNDYNRSDPRASDLLTAEDANALINARTVDRRFVMIKIEFEHTDNIYYIKKIGDYHYDDDSTLREGLIKGSGYFAEGTEYLAVFYPYLTRYFSPPAIAPVRFSIIKGVPVIQMVDY